MRVRTTFMPDVVFEVGPQEFTDLSRQGAILEVLSDKSVTEVKSADASSAKEQEGVS